MLGGWPAKAEVSDWATSEGGRVRIAALSERDPGKITALIQIEPAPGWKTYWRAPGDSGMPPQIDLSSASNLHQVGIGYSVPEVGRDEAGRFIGYHAPAGIVIDLEKVDPQKSATLSADIMIGFCKDICLPFQSHFALALDDSGQPKADEFMQIQMAKATLPEAPSPGFEVTGSALTADRSYFEATITVPGKELPDIAAAPSVDLLLGKPTIIIDAGVAQARYPVVRLPKSKAAATLTLLVKSGTRAMETTLAVK
jgi:DsbC/DsbD-like thiol-disulfide interchange protein